MPHDESMYLIERAEAEIELAQRAKHPRAVAAHYQLSEAYLDRAYGAGKPTKKLGITDPTSIRADEASVSE